LGTRLGTVHVGSQDLSGLVLKKNRALRKAKHYQNDMEEEGDAADQSSKKKHKKLVADPKDI
jgi:hypothetical protein